MRNLLLIALLIVLSVPIAMAQELNCSVSVISPRIQSSDKRIFTTLQTSIMEFINNTKWTNDKIKNEEKIPH